MATEPPVATRKYSMNGFRSTHASAKQLSTSFSVTGTEASRALEKAPIQFSTMINEIEHVRSRFASEKSNSDQFSSQLRMLSQQIESLTGQQSSMLEFHIGRMDTMLKELKSSGDVAKEQQRAAFEAQRRAKFEREECERREKLERERIEREQRAKFEREQRQRVEREERERREMIKNLERERQVREQREREHHEKMQNLQQTSLPSMNLSDIIPQPSRTVTSSKRKLSLDLGNSRTSQQVDNKRAKVDATNGSSDDFNSLFQQFMNKETETQADQSSPDVNNAVESTNAVGIETTPMEDSELPADDDSGPADMDTSLPMQPRSDLPTDIHEALKQQAMAMLQAQLDAGASSASSQLDMDLPPLDDGIPPSSAQVSAIVKAEPAAKPPALPTPSVATAYQNHLSSSSSSVSAAVVKSEQKVVQLPPNKATRKSAGGSKKAKKEVIPAVEDTTITDPMSVPLKNKAIHQWMSKDPERLYTADDICKAGIRYRVRFSVASLRLLKGRVYVLDSANCPYQKREGGSDMERRR